MKLKDISREELEMMSYAEIAEIILKENKKKMKIVDIFKKICTALGLTEAEFENRISEFFEIISTNKLFTILPQGYCDLKTRHNTKVVIDEEEEEIVVEDEVSEDVEEDTEDEDIFYDDTEDDDVSEDELQDFVVIDEDDEVNS